MCTGFIKRGSDVIFGFNMDLPEGLWSFRVCPRKDMFFVGILFNGRLFKTHGVNAAGQFANLPYMNAPACGAFRRGRGFRRLDLLVNDYIAGKLDFQDLRDVTARSSVVNAPGCSMHSLFGDAAGRMFLVEPGFPARELTGDHAVISNFPIQGEPGALRPELACWYGEDRYQKAEEMLEKAGDEFGLTEGMEILEAVSQTAPAPTRVSFVYSVKTRTLRYALERNYEETVEYQLIGQDTV